MAAAHAGPSTFPDVSKMTTRPLTSERRATGTALLVQTAPIAPVEMEAAMPIICTAFAAATCCIAGRAAQQAAAVALASMAKRRVPSCLLPRGMMTMKNRMFHTAERARNEPTSRSEIARPPIGLEEMAQRGTRSMRPMVCTPCRKRMKTMRGIGQTNSNLYALLLSGPVFEGDPSASPSGAEYCVEQMPKRDGTQKQHKQNAMSA
mmetsp:Transcript_28883/g.82571  ORF Transcript_28883/g.82571 Transcript_28883/m.82571 type:complete len:206 (+) Transcript_28883:454-1071(+)